MNPSSLSGFQRRFAAKVADEKQSNRRTLEPTALTGFEQRFATKIAEEKRQRRERDAEAKAARREDLKRADQPAPGDQWLENRTRRTTTDRCPAPLSNQARLRARRVDGGEQMLDLFATDKRVVLQVG